MAKPLTVGKLAKELGVTAVTIRYYEERGLIKPARSKAGYRHFSEDSIPQLRFVLNAKEVGFSLKEIEDLITFVGSKKATSADIKKRAQTKIKELDEKINRLKDMKKVLECWEDTCDGKVAVEHCPILNSLYSHHPQKLLEVAKKKKTKK